MKDKEFDRSSQTIFNFISEAIFIHDVPSMNIIEVNESMLKIYGYENESEVISGTVGDLSSNIPPYDEDNANYYIQKAINECPQKFEWLAKRKDGSTFWMEINLKKIDYSGKTRILAVGRDITEQKQTQKILEEQTNELKATNATKDKFLSIIAHDLKNPFNAIIGFTDLMLMNFSDLDNETLLQGLNTIKSASKHAYKLLDNLLIWSLNQTGQIPFHPEYLNLNSQIHESFKTVESTASLKGIKVIISLDKSIQVWADKNMIDSILRNLISNAVKFSEKGGKVNITARKMDHKIEISVKDNGVGIAPETQSAIFRIDKHTITLGTENEEGTGLGLILCKDFVNRHNGTIWVESKPGKGSIFTFSLPII